MHPRHEAWGLFCFFWGYIFSTRICAQNKMIKIPRLDWNACCLVQRRDILKLWFSTSFQTHIRENVFSFPCSPSLGLKRGGDLECDVPNNQCDAQYAKLWAAFHLCVFMRGRLSSLILWFFAKLGHNAWINLRIRIVLVGSPEFWIMISVHVPQLIDCHLGFEHLLYSGKDRFTKRNIISKLSETYL